MSHEGKFLKKILKDKNITHENFVEASGISRTTLNVIFKEETIPDRFRSQIEDALKIKIQDFVRTNNNPKFNAIYVPLSAWGGYLRNYENPVFIESLEHTWEPELVGLHYVWPAQGFSMHKAGDEKSAKGGDKLYSIKIESLNDLVKGRGYVIQSVDGINYKLFVKMEGDKVFFESLNNEEGGGLIFKQKDIKGIYWVDEIRRKTY